MYVDGAVEPTPHVLKRPEDRTETSASGRLLARALERGRARASTFLGEYRGGRAEVARLE